MDLYYIVIFLAIVAAIAFALIRKRGLMGAIVGGKTEKTYGEVQTSWPKIGSMSLKVHKLNKKGIEKIVLEARYGTIASFQATPIVLDKSQLSELRVLLEQAANDI